MDNIDELGHLTDTEPDDDLFDYTTDNYDEYNKGGEIVSPLMGSIKIDQSGHLVSPDNYFPTTLEKKSVMDPDPDHVGPMTDFWSNYPITIDVSGYVYEHENENTGMNIRGPAGVSIIKFDELTPAQKSQLKGENGAPGINGIDGTNGKDGEDGLDAYHLWLEENGYTEDLHPIEEFWAYLANYDTNDILIKEGSGNGSLILNYRGDAGTASGIGALATGGNTVASGKNSSSFGLHTTASRANSMAIGQYNTPNVNNLFTIGNGNENATGDALTVDYNGNLKTSGEITDGHNNRLIDKVDKVAGKGLSTNDFTNSYKNFLDNYTVDPELDSLSPNPVQNRAIYEAIQAVQGSDNVQQNYTEADKDMVFLSPTVQSSGQSGVVQYQTGFTFNPAKRNFLSGTEVENEDESINTDIFGYGEGLVTAANGQTVFGKYNDADENAIFQVGAGGAANRANALNLATNGDLTVKGQITDGLGNRLSEMQTALLYDSEPTQSSQRMVNSGDLYTYLVAHGINPAGGLNIPELTALRAEVASLRAEVAGLRARVEACEAGFILTDDTTLDKYKLGVDNGEVYATLYETYIPPEEEEEQGE